MKLAEVQDALKDAFDDALKDRFKTIATNVLIKGPQEGSAQFDNALRNLKTTYELGMAAASKIFTD